MVRESSGKMVCDYMYVSLPWCASPELPCVKTPERGLLPCWGCQGQHESQERQTWSAETGYRISARDQEQRRGRGNKVREYGRCKKKLVRKGTLLTNI